MAQTLQTTVLASGVDSTSLYANRMALYNYENAQPEGALMELSLTLNLPKSASMTVDQIAASFNTKAKNQGIVPWPGTTDLAYTASPSQLSIRWKKGQPWILIVIGIILVVIVAVIIYLQGWRFEKGMFVNINTGQQETPGQFLQKGLPQALGNAVQGAFNNLPLVLVGAGVLFFGTMALLNKGRGATVQVFDPNGYRAQERHAARQVRVVANERFRADQRKQRTTDRRADRRQREADEQKILSTEQVANRARQQTSRANKQSKQRLT